MTRPSSIALLLVLFLAGVACADDDGSPGTTGATTGPSATGATGPSSDPSDSPTGSESPQGEPGSELEDGRHFGFIRSVDVEGLSVDFDLASFLTGDAANEAAQEHGDEVPVPNDYYIVNDNPALRTLGLGPDLRLVLLDWNRCCDETFLGELATFAEAVNGGDRVVVDDLVYEPRGPFWVTVAGGVVTEIEEHYLP